LLTRGLPTQLAPRVPIDREDLPLRHSLISQIIKQLAEARHLPAIQRLANRDGCVSTVASLIGELQRAGTSAEEFRNVVESRGLEVQSPESKVQSPKTQLDFDRDVALIYAKYSEVLDRFGLTDEDADQLRALQILRSDGAQISWLDNIELLVLDGFFDFTPVQGEMLRLLIPRLPNVIVNVNHDSRNEQTFQPFQSTIEQLKSIADFEIKSIDDCAEVTSTLTPLRSRLFSASATTNDDESAGKMPATRLQDAGAPVLLRECSDRETELRWIAKEIKRLIFADNYKLSDVALVVRERAAYAESILRVFETECVPCNLERRMPANEIPAVRASAKLFQILKSPGREHVVDPKANDLAHLVKTAYFRVSAADLKNLTSSFDKRYAKLLEVEPGSEQRHTIARASRHWHLVPRCHRECNRVCRQRAASACLVGSRRRA
jgi:ATP-dependent helicase/DNAse subunit B